MDPLSFTASLTAVLTLATQVITTCYSYTSAVASSSSDAQRLAQEVATISGLLAGLQNTVQRVTDPDAQWLLGMEAMTGEFGEVLEALRGRLERAPGGGKKSDQEMLQGVKVEGKGFEETMKKLIWPLKKKGLEEVLVRLDIVKGSATNALVQGSVFIGTEMQKEQERIRVEKLDAESDSHSKEIHAWLSTINHEEMHNKASALTHQGSGRWLINSDVVKQWVADRAGFLWLSGKSGAGKTILTSTLLKEVVLPQCHQNAIVAYYYFDFREKGSQTPEAALGSILSQICVQVGAVPAAIEESFRKHTATPNGQQRQADFAELERLLCEVLKDLSRSAVFALDALDECVDRTKILTFLANLESLPNPVQAFVTSRPEEDIVTAFSAKLRIDIQNVSVSDDVHRYLEHVMTVIPRLKGLKDDLKLTIISYLTERCDGMFRWVQCQIEELSRLRTDKAIRKALKTLPRDLHETYERMMCKIPAEDTEIARRALVWLSTARRPLTIKELNEAVIVELDDIELDPEARLRTATDVIFACGCLVETFDAGYVALAHHSVNDFLRSKETQRRFPTFSIQQTQCDLELAKICLTYILFRNFQDGECTNEAELEARLSNFPLYRYATYNWPEHAKSVMDEVEDLFQLACTLLKPPRTAFFRAWIQVIVLAPRRWNHGAAIKFPTQATPLCYAAYFGFANICKKLLQQGVRVEAKGGRYGSTALHSAVWQNHREVIDVLLDAGASVSIKDSHGMSPVEYAELSSNARLPQLLEKCTLPRGSLSNDLLASGMVGRALMPRRSALLLVQPSIPSLTSLLAVSAADAPFNFQFARKQNIAASGSANVASREFYGNAHRSKRHDLRVDLNFHSDGSSQTSRAEIDSENNLKLSVDANQLANRLTHIGITGEGRVADCSEDSWSKNFSLISRRDSNFCYESPPGNPRLDISEEVDVIPELSLAPKPLHKHNAPEPRGRLITASIENPQYESDYKEEDELGIGFGVVDENEEGADGG